MHGLYLIWWVQERHVAAASVAQILAAGDLALTALEVPTGWLADRFGHRASLMLGSLLQVAGMLICWLGSGVPGLLAASVVVAAGVFYITAAAVIRQLANRRRMTAWDADWVTTAPMWNRQRW